MLRRNGKPRSCEPCRISKIRCDHEEPVCQKCQTRGIAAQCFYHPAPMTKPAGTPRKQSEHRRRVLKQKYSETRDTRDHETQFSITTALRNDALSIASPSIGDSLPTPPESATRSTIASEPPPARSFYLGSTSYASVFAEEGPIPESMHADATDRSSQSAVLSPECPGGVATPMFPPKQTKRRFCQHQVGHSILSRMTPFPLIETSVKMYFAKTLSTCLESALVVSALPQLRADLDQLPKAGSDTLELWAEMTRNTTRPIKVPSTMAASEFHTLFTGRNLRWETLGLVLMLAGMNAQYTSPDDPIFTQNGRKIDRDEFIEQMIHASNECIHLCQAHGCVNDIMVWLLYHNMLAVSNFYGDNYHGVWRRLSETISALFAEGIHCEGSFNEPLWLRECRRRLFSAVYRSDKTMSTFLGRPPLMAFRYTDRPTPLDVDDNVTASDPQVVKEALSKLDSEGWNTEGKIYTVSWLRVRFQMSLLKERMLELSLVGTHSVDPNLTEKLQSISKEMSQQWKSLPPQLRYDLYHPPESAWASLSPQVTLRMISAYLEYLHMDFQIHRILRRENAAGSLATPFLLEISMRLLQTTLIFNKQRSQPYSVQRHFPTLILMYCLPSAGVLALELRRCTREGVPMPGDVRRADVIRNLSVLISCLEWVVLPSDGNHRLCSELNKMLALVLDEVLNHQPVSNHGTPVSGAETAGAIGAEGAEGNSSATLDDSFFNMPLIEGMEPIPTESEDFLNWLDNANWNNTYLF